VHPLTPQNREQEGRKILARLADERIDAVVLARYMQVLGGELVQAYRGRMINIHHSFLPAFAGGRPYHQAYARGVKVIGATAHYVTEQLDEGPIIEQDVVRVSHRDSVEDMVRKGRDLERVVLARAVRLHVRRRVLVYGNRTVVFD
jgi:formyltetrahydrofolate deformylase